MRKKWFSILMIVVLIVPILAGCLKPEMVESNEPKVLRVFASQYVMEQYSPLFEVTYQNVEIELMDMDKIYQEIYRQQQEAPDKQIDPKEKLIEILDGPNAPDIIITDQSTFPELIDQGRLLPLDSFIEKSNYDLDGIAPAVREGIRDLGDGALYALAPTFNAMVLFYNKDWFDKRNVPYPSDGITWDQMMDIARQLTYEENGEKKHGLTFDHYGDLFYQVEYYLAPLDLSLFDSDFTTFNVDIPVVERAWNYFNDLQNEELLAPPFDWEKARDRPISPFEREAFLGGKAAMMIGQYYQLRNLSSWMSGRYYYGPDVELPEPFEWDIAVLPTHSEAPDIGFGSSLNNLMAINAKAENPELAWEFISFINGEKVGKVLAKRGWDLVARTELMQAPDGLSLNMEAFSALKPAKANMQMEFTKQFPDGHLWSILSIGNDEFRAVLNGDKTVKEGLAEYQRRGQEQLDQMNKVKENGVQTEIPDAENTNSEGTNS